MALRLRVTVPDGALHEHLKHLTPAGQRFELVRLATNHLSASSLLHASENTASERSSLSKEAVLVDSASKSSQVSTLVDFGDDLLGLS